MRICLDTSGYSAFKRGHERAIEFVRRSSEIVIPVTVLGELLAGFRRGERERRNLEELDRFLENPRVGAVPVDEETASCYAEILIGLRERGTPIPTNDIWIAASAMQGGLSVVTGDGHFARVPQVTVELLELE
jgi:tRNA(fMet)-specific endonuclease VapC